MFGIGLVSQIALFLVETLFSLYIGAVILRLLLGIVRANFRNPLSQFLVKITNPILVPMRRFVPALGSVDTAAVLLAYGLMVLKVSLMFLIVRGAIMFPESLFIAVGELVKSVIWIYIIALLFQAIISWVGNAQGNPVVPLIHSLTQPLLAPIRKVLPLIGMFDLSPLVAILGLQILLMVANHLLPSL